MCPVYQDNMHSLHRCFLTKPLPMFGIVALIGVLGHFISLIPDLRIDTGFMRVLEILENP